MEKGSTLLSMLKRHDLNSLKNLTTEEMGLIA